MLKQKIQDFCNTLGLDTVGFIPCRKFNELERFYIDRKKQNLENEFEEQNLEKRINPHFYMETAKTIISIAFPYYDQEESCSNNGFSVYTKRLDYHRVVKKYLNQISNYIETLGGKSISLVDSNALPERYIAYLAGIGFIGRNNMLITKKYGSYVFLGEIITDLEIKCEDQRCFEEVNLYKECGSCVQCIQECPTKSINKRRINPNICLSYMTQKKELSDQEMNLLKGNLFGCDFCQLQCPYNIKIELKALEEFKMLEYMNDEVEVYAGMDNRYFKEKMAQTSCGWRGKNVIKRNALIHMSRTGHNLENFKGDSPYLNNYIDRLNQLKK